MNITEKIKAYISRFQAWQRNPIKYENRNPSTVICANCGHEITENFCPLCGQKATIGRIRWKTIRIGFMTIWGMESRSFLYSIWQLLWRPGHLISDFLNGRRQTCFPPIRMIVILGLVLALLDYLFEDETKETPQKGLSFIKTIGYWLENHPEWSFMLLCCFFIVPTWFLFRYAPRHNHHTLPEGFFIQVFITILIIVFSGISELTGDWIAILIPLYSVSIYKTVFGYNLWGTLWRLLFCLFGACTIFFPVLYTAILLFTKEELSSKHGLLGDILAICILLLLAAGTLLLGSYLRKKNKKH